MKEIREKLFRNKEAGLTKDAALAILESLRGEAPYEAFEERVLEVMDFVAGFCAKEWKIWED